MRQKYKQIFKDAEFTELKIEDGFIFYKRQKDNQNIYVYTNNSSKKYLLNLSEKYLDVLENKILENNLIIQPNSYKIFIKAEN